MGKEVSDYRDWLDIKPWDSIPLVGYHTWLNRFQKKGLGFQDWPEPSDKKAELRQKAALLEYCGVLTYHICTGYAAISYVREILENLL